MPDSWDPERYKERAKAWRDKAASFPEGRERDACVILAEDYLVVISAYSAWMRYLRTRPGLWQERWRKWPIRP